MGLSLSAKAYVLVIFPKTKFVIEEVEVVRFVARSFFLHSSTATCVSLLTDFEVANCVNSISYLVIFFSVIGLFCMLLITYHFNLSFISITNVVSSSFASYSRLCTPERPFKIFSSVLEIYFSFKLSFHVIHFVKTWGLYSTLQQ